MLRRIAAVFKKEFVQLKRDRRTAAMAVVIPIIWLIVFGYAANFNISSLPTIIVDRSGTEDGSRLTRILRQEKALTAVEGDFRTEKDVRDALKNGRAKVGVVIPNGFGEDKDAAPVVFTDGTDLFSSQTAVGKLLARYQVYGKETMERQRDKAFRVLKASPLSSMIPIDPTQLGQIATPKVEHLFNPKLKSADIMIPGLVGMVLLFILTLMTALGVVRERERGTLEQLIVTPIKPVELMLGKILPYVIIGIIDFVLVISAGLLLFDVPFRGGLLPFAIASLAFLVCSLGLGLLVSTVSQNQQQALQLAMFMLFPQFILSGFIFPLESMPAGIRWIGYAFPLTHFLPVSRAAFLKGDNVAGVWTSVGILILYASAMIGLASARFKKRLA